MPAPSRPRILFNRPTTGAAAATWSSTESRVPPRGVKNLHAQNICAIVELEEIAVKTTNEFNEQYNIWISDGHLRKGRGAHITTCFPATF